MCTIDFVRTLALSFPETTEQPHFEKTSFRIKNKIFATYDSENQLLCLLLNAVDQDVFCSFEPQTISPVPNKWGKNGATYVQLPNVNKDVLTDALTTAYCKAAPKKLSLLVRNDQ